MFGGRLLAALFSAIDIACAAVCDGVPGLDCGDNNFVVKQNLNEEQSNKWPLQHLQLPLAKGKAAGSGDGQKDKKCRASGNDVEASGPLTKDEAAD